MTTEKRAGLLFTFLPELTSLGVVTSSPIISSKVSLYFLLIILIKILFIIFAKFNASEGREYVFKSLLIAVCSFLFDARIIITYVLGDSEKSSDVIRNINVSLGMACAGILAAWLIILFNPKLSRIIKHPEFSVFLLTGFYILIFVVYKFLGTGLADGSISAGSFSIQLPELLKAATIIYTFIVSEFIKVNRKFIIGLPVMFAVSSAMMLIVFKEKGTCIVLFYYTCIMSYILISQYFPTKNVTTKNLILKYIPVISLNSFFIFTGLLRVILNRKFIERGDDGKSLYGEADKLFILSSRISADDAQTVQAREALNNSSLFSSNLKPEVSIRWAKYQTLLADYAYAVLNIEFGKIISVALTLLFILLLTISIYKSKNVLARASAAMLLCQIFVHLSGIVFSYLFTGVNYPVLSTGGSSTFTSFMFLTFVIINTMPANEP